MNIAATGDNGGISQSGQRSYPRIEMPLGVEIGGVRYEAADWSLGGFGLGERAPPAARGDILKCRLLLRFACFDTSMEITAKVVRVVDGTGRGFQFIDMTTERAEVLGYIVDNHLAGELVAVPDLVARSGPGEIVFSDAAMRRLRLVAAGLRFAAVLAVAMVVIALGGLSLAASFFTVRSEYAAVASGRTVARAPESGFVQGPALPIGVAVPRGAPLFEIVPPVKPQALAELEHEIAVLESRLAQEEDALIDVETAFYAWEDRLKMDLAAARRRAALARAEVDAHRRLHARLAGLAADGQATRSRVDEAEVRLRTAERQQAEVSALITRIEEDLRLAGAGLYMGDNNSGRDTPGDLRRAIRVTRAALAGKTAALGALQERYLVRSPCDCVVEVALGKAGEYVSRGATVYELGEVRGRAAEVDVLVPAEQVGLLRAGMAAGVLFPDRPQELQGRIGALTLNPQNTGRGGLPDELRAFGRFALATVALDPAAAAPPTGTPAIVTIRVPLGNMLYRLTGLDWLLPTAEDTPDAGAE